ncbi:hypothetical protein AAVH_29822, partial [Aphelenchoides avenae]
SSSLTPNSSSSPTLASNGRSWPSECQKTSRPANGNGPMAPRCDTPTGTTPTRTAPYTSAPTCVYLRSASAPGTRCAAFKGLGRRSANILRSTS